MNQITIFKNFTTIIAHQSLEQIITAIKSNHYKKQVMAIREAAAKGDSERKDFLKKQLDAFTVSGRFEGGRTMQTLTKYHPLVVLDIDKLDHQEVERIRRQATQIQYTRAGFVSPSGMGYKIIVQTNATLKNHKTVFHAVAKYYEQQLQVSIDKSGKDVTRLCFLSHDPNTYYNKDSKTFEVNNPETKHQVVFMDCIHTTNQHSKYIEGNRNNYIFLLAANCKSAGIPREAALAMCCQKFDLSNKEIERTINSCYNRTQQDVPKKPSTINGQQSEYFQPDPPPFFPDKIFDKLPGLLAKACSVFVEKRERDVYLTGALGVLSGCMPNTSGAYDRRVTYPNLYTFIIAPAASGKGMLAYAKILGMARHSQLLSDSRKDIEAYKKEKQRYEVSQYNFRKGKIPNPPKEPEVKPLKVLFIPANSSSAMLIRQLQSNASNGILFETEADTLGNVLKQDWGGYSDILRKAAHHECISYSRKQNDEFVEITTPRLSVVLSGTPNQVISLIPSVEDGLFSRFLFYIFDIEVVWRDVSPAGADTNFREHFKNLSEEVLEMISFLEKHPTEFNLRKDQWAFLNDSFGKALQRINKRVGQGALSIVKRLGLISFRIAMILSSIRKFENKNTQPKLHCQGDDFHTAISLAETYLEHALYLYEQLPQSEFSAMSGLSEKKKQLYQLLPDQFKRKQAVEQGKQFGLSERTIDRLLKKLEGLLLSQPTYGFYQKI